LGGGGDGLYSRVGRDEGDILLATKRQLQSNIRSAGALVQLLQDAGRLHIKVTKKKCPIPKNTKGDWESYATRQKT